MTVEPYNTLSRRGFRRGLTFLEIVAATAILGMLAGVVFGGFSAMISTQERQQRRLACMEVANRLVLQYLDDPLAMPNPALPVEYAGLRYRWTLTQEVVTPAHARPDLGTELAATSSLRFDRLVNLHFTVWLAEESGGSVSFDATVPNASLSRLYDPINTRNPDSLENIFKNPESAAYRHWWDQLERASTTTRSRTPSRSPSSGPGTPGRTNTPGGGGGK